MPDQIPKHLLINNRPKLNTTKFDPEDRLYRSYNLEELNDLNQIDTNTLGFPDLSCNWSCYSEPQDILLRENGKETDGCYSFSVETARHKDIATPVHDPISGGPYENYAHVEVRELLEDETIITEPPKKRRKRKTSKYKERRNAYRRYLIQNLRYEINARA